MEIKITPNGEVTFDDVTNLYTVCDEWHQELFVTESRDLAVRVFTSYAATLDTDHPSIY